MALISEFIELSPSERPRVHPTEVQCGWRVERVENRLVLTLETYGSSDRMIPGKTSQSIQLTEESAAELVAILGRAFPV